MSQKCEVCESELRFHWTDTHGVGVCGECGAPYKIYHYENVDGESRRVDRPPLILLLQSGINIAKRYWSEQRSRSWRCPSGGSD